MTIDVQVIGERTNSYEAKRGKVTEQILACLDLTPDHAFINTFDYALNGDEAERLTGKLVGKRIRLAGGLRRRPVSSDGPGLPSEGSGPGELRAVVRHDPARVSNGDATAPRITARVDRSFARGFCPMQRQPFSDRKTEKNQEFLTDPRPDSPGSGK